MLLFLKFFKQNENKTKQNKNKTKIKQKQYETSPKLLEPNGLVTGESQHS